MRTTPIAAATLAVALLTTMTMPAQAEDAAQDAMETLVDETHPGGWWKVMELGSDGGAIRLEMSAGAGARYILGFYLLDENDQWFLGANQPYARPDAQGRHVTLAPGGETLVSEGEMGPVSPAPSQAEPLAWTYGREGVSKIVAYGIGDVDEWTLRVTAEPGTSLLAVEEGPGGFFVTSQDFDGTAHARSRDAMGAGAWAVVEGTYTAAVDGRAFVVGGAFNAKAACGLVACVGQSPSVSYTITSPDGSEQSCGFLCGLINAEPGDYTATLTAADAFGPDVGISPTCDGLICQGAEITQSEIYFGGVGVRIP